VDAVQVDAVQVDAVQVDAVQVDAALEKSMATIVTAVGAGTGVAFQQFVEPFVMVGPYIENSMPMVQALDQCWDSMLTAANQLRIERTNDAIAAIAALEPIDTDSLGPSVLMKNDVLMPNDEIGIASDPTLIPGIVVTPIDALVGSAAMIVTINEPYMPYDMSVSDLRLRSVFPMSTKPFCVRSRAAQWNPVPMSTEVEHLQLAKLQKKKVLYPVDCYMDELIWALDSMTERGSRLWSITKPEFAGEQLATLVSRGNQIAYRATDLIASHWPEPIAKPSAAGRALLIRAGADPGIHVVDSAAIMVAEFPSDSLTR
jgi:hypothetical protein